MASRWTDYQIVPNGGLNLDENPNAVAQNELTVATNVWYRGTSLGTRPGMSHETEGSSFTAALTGPVQGGVDYRSGNDSTRNLVVVSNGVIYSNNSGGTITKDGAVTVTSGAAKLWTFATHADVLYAAGGSLTDTPWIWSGSGNALPLNNSGSYAIKDSAAGSVFPTYIFAKWKRLFACDFRDHTGVISTDITCDPMTPRFCALNQPTVWPTGNTFAGTGVGGLPSYGDEFLTGFGEYTDNSGDFLMLLTNRHLYAVQEDPTNPYAPFAISRLGAISFGCVSQRAYVSLGLDSGDAIYLSEHGIHSLRQTQQFGAAEDKVISWKIRSVFRTVNRAQLKYAVGHYFREEGLVVFALPTGSDTFNSLMLVLDVKGVNELTAANARWTMWRAGGTSSQRKITALFPARSTTGKWFLYGGNVNGDVFRFDDTAQDDMGSSYESTFQTAWSDFGAPQQQKVLGDLYPQMQPQGNYAAVLNVKADFGDRTSGPYSVALPQQTGAQLGSFILGTDTFASTTQTSQPRVYATGIGTNFALQFARSSSDTPFYIAKVSGRVAPYGISRGI